MGWPKDEQKAEVFGANIRVVAKMGQSIIAARFLAHRGPEVDKPDSDELWDVPEGSIDVWWRGMQNGALMLLLAHLLHQNTEWRSNRIRLLRVVEKEEGRQEVYTHLLELAASARIDCDVHVVVSTASPQEVIQSESSQAAIVLMGFQTPSAGAELELFQRMEQLTEHLPRVLFVESAGGMALDS